MTGNGVAYPESPRKGVRRVPDLGPEARNQYRKGRSCVCRNAFTSARCLSARICWRLSRSAGQRERRSCQSRGARYKQRIDRVDLASALARSGRSFPAPARRLPSIGRSFGMGATAAAVQRGAGPQADHLPRMLTSCTAVSFFSGTAVPLSGPRVTEDPPQARLLRPQALRRPPGRTPPASCATAPA